MVQVCSGVVGGAVGGTCLVLNRESPLPVGGGEKHSEMGEYFFSRRPLVLFPEISRKNACVEHKLVVVVHNFLGKLGCGSGVGICYGVINLTPDDLGGVGGGVCLAEALVIRNPVCIGYDGVGLVELDKQIQRDGSAIPSVRPVFYPYKVVLNSAQKLLPNGAVYVPNFFESKRRCVVSVADGLCFGSGGACQDYRRRSVIGRWHNPCCREGHVDGGRES